MAWRLRGFPAPVGHGRRSPRSVVCLAQLIMRELYAGGLPAASLCSIQDNGPCAVPCMDVRKQPANKTTGHR